MKKLILIPLLLLSIILTAQNPVIQTSDNKVLIIDGKLSTVGSGPLTNMRTGIFNVLDYGAVGNGVTDDGPEIQAAMVAAKAGRGIVYFPPGTYIANLSTTQIAVDDSLQLVGSGIDKTIIQCTPATPTANRNLFLIDAGGTMWIRNMTLSAPLTGDGGYEVIAVNHSGTSGGIYADNVKFSGFTDGLKTNSGTAMFIKASFCYFTNAGRIGSGILTSNSGTGTIKVTNCYFYSVGASGQDHGIYCTDNYNTEVSNCRFETLTGAGVQMYGGSVGAGNYKQVTNCQFISCVKGIVVSADSLSITNISGNEFKSTTYGIHTYRSFSIITNNHFDKATIGIYHEDNYLSKSIISNNVFILDTDNIGVYSYDTGNEWIVHDNIAISRGTGETLVTCTAGNVYTHLNKLYFGVTMSGNTTE